MSAVALKNLHPKPLHIAVIYALRGMELGILVASMLTAEYRPNSGWTLNR